MRCEECGRLMDNAEMWQLGGDRNAPTSRSMRQMCWECRTKGVANHRKKEEQAETPLSKTVIAEINEAARALEEDAV